MSTIPTRPDEAITWVQTRIAPWVTHAELLKLDAQTVAQLGALASAAADAQQAKVTAQGIYEDSVTAYNNAVKAMRTLAGGQLSIIRSTAKNAANPQAIYTAAIIPAPSAPSPAPAPGTPTTFKHQLAINGELSVAFRCPNPGRTGPVTYRLERRVGGTGQPFVPFMTLKERKFTDATIPLGTAEVAYRVTPQTSTKDGGVAQFAIQFGSGNQSTLVMLTPEESGTPAKQVA